MKIGGSRQAAFACGKQKKGRPAARTGLGFKLSTDEFLTTGQVLYRVFDSLNHCIVSAFAMCVEWMSVKNKVPEVRMQQTSKERRRCTCNMHKGGTWKVAAKR